MVTSTTYDVCLSSTGDVTRYYFTDDLYMALVHADCSTFFEQDEIEGEARRHDSLIKIHKALRMSRISIVLFSKEYASSTWCLDQLVRIVERKKLCGLAVVPVFFQLTPFQVREQTGSFAEAFSRHEKLFKEERNRVEGWRAALREVADVPEDLVFQVHNRYLNELIEKVVKHVCQLKYKVRSASPYLVGVEHSTLRPISSWLQDGKDEVGIASIFGIAGIGKTEIAKVIYNLNSRKFERSSFLENVNEMPTSGMQMQQKLLSDLDCRKIKINSAAEANMNIKHAISNKKVLLVLDDVDRLEQLDVVLAHRDSFYPGSKIIITTRRKYLLRNHNVNLTLEVPKLNDDELLKLFSLHAFGQDDPDPVYEKQSKEVVHHCAGLPSAVCMLGSYLSHKNVTEWESEIHQMKQHLHPSIREILRTNYYRLPDDRDRSLFFYVACFFTGMDVDRVTRIMDDLKFNTTVGIWKLMDRCLIDIDEDNKLMMHPLLGHIGREIGLQTSLVDPRKSSILRIFHEATYVISQKVTLDWVFILTNLALEIVLLTFDQIASPKKPQYALIALVVSLGAMLICIAELVYKGHKQSVSLDRQRTRGWLQYASSTYTWIDFFSFFTAVSQCVFASIAYSFLCRAVDNPIKVSFVSAIFVVCLATSKLVNNPKKEIPPGGQNNERFTGKEHAV